MLSHSALLSPSKTPLPDREQWDPQVDVPYRIDHVMAAVQG